MTTDSPKTHGKPLQPCTGCGGTEELFSVSVRIARKGFTANSSVVSLCAFCIPVSLCAFCIHDHVAIPLVRLGPAAQQALKKINLSESEARELVKLLQSTLEETSTTTSNPSPGK